jgi:hypothetical protein
MGDWSGTVPTILPGDIPSGDDWKNILDELSALSAAWTAYSPAWTGTVSDPAISNGTITGAYRRIGATLNVRVRIVMGSTTTFGSGVYRISLPYALKNGSLLVAACVDASAGSVAWTGAARIFAETATGDNMRIVVTDGVAGISPTVPFTWAASDILTIAGAGELA